MTGSCSNPPDDLRSSLGYGSTTGKSLVLEMARSVHGWGRDLAARIGGDVNVTEEEAGPKRKPHLRCVLLLCVGRAQASSQ